MPEKYNMPTQPLWQPTPEQIASSNLTRFAQQVGEKYNRDFSRYEDLYDWSVNHVDQFWSAIWDASDIVHSRKYDHVISDHSMPGAVWFKGARLNFAANLLRYRDNRPAIVHHREGPGAPIRITYKELHKAVARCAAGLKRLGLRKDDRVAAFVPNVPEAVIAMLATTSIGALWSSCSPDFGHRGVLDRFEQITPKILITADGYRYNGTTIDSLERARHIADAIPQIERTVVIPILEDRASPPSSKILSWKELLSQDTDVLDFEDLPFDHPVYIMYSSGTTGVPKCIVHGASGTLLQHWKEHVLHTNLTRNDIISYYTTCGWMMWNWLVSALQVGATIVLYDGSPAWPSIDALWEMIESEKITVFGTSPKFLSTCQNAGLEPGNEHDLSSLKAILSTGAPLTAANCNWVYEEVASDVRLSSISGGTDIVSCFMLGNPNLPVFSEEIQCRGLGMKVESFDESGQSTDSVGELVCTAPFPSMPIGFWNDPNDEKYRAAYFERFPGVWRHGDYIKITDRSGVVVYGRSDATLNPGGVRIGTAEIYNPVEALDEVTDSIVVGQRWNDDTRVVLFVVLADGLTLTDNLRDEIRERIRERATPRHVPAKIIQVLDIPHTINGKKVEMAVTRIIHGQDVPNKDALANPESLGQFTGLADLQV